MRLTLLFLFATCSLAFSQIAVSSRYFSVVSATERAWSAGTTLVGQQSTAGKIYELHVRLRKSGNIQFQYLFINDQFLDLETLKGNERMARGPFRKGEKITLICRTGATPSSPPEEVMNALVSKKSEVWICYQVAEQRVMSRVRSQIKKQSSVLSN